MNKFDQHIKDKLSQPQLPPMEAWKNIQEKLDKKEKKKRIIPIFYWIGSTAACLVTGIAVYFFSQNETIHTNQFPANEIVKTTSKNTKNQSISSKKLKENPSDDQSITSTKNQIALSKNFSQNKSISYTENKIEESTLFSNTTSRQQEKQTRDFSLINPSQNNTSIQKSNPSTEKETITETELIAKNQEEKSLELVLEEEKKKNNDNVIVKQKSPILTVSSYVNPTMMLESKSILGDEFNDHNIKNNITVAYGAKVSVRVNDKLNIRSGVAKVELGQSTTNINSGVPTSVYAFSSNNPKSSNNIKYHTNVRVVTDNIKHNTSMTMSASEANNMEQKIHYIEVPLEVEYKLASFDKFNLLATAGGSYYVVTKNSISLTDTNTRSQYKLGEANNLNNNSYSANAGVKLEYNLSNKSSINLEPNYRYMINPLINVEAKNPSLLGLNLGFSIKF